MPFSRPSNLAPRGISVDLLICVDVAMPYDVAANVHHAIHLYRTYRRLYPARPLRPAPDSAARIKNVDLDGADSPIPAKGLRHLNITGSPAVQAWILDQILKTVALTDHRV